MDRPNLNTNHQGGQTAHSQDRTEGAYKEQLQSIAIKIRRSSFFNRSNKHIRIRLEKWMDELSKYEFNPLWRTNKLNYLAILYQMCQSAYLMAPFTVFPTKDLRILQKHQVANLTHILQRQQKLPNKHTVEVVASMDRKEKQHIKEQRICSMTKPQKICLSYNHSIEKQNITINTTHKGSQKIKRSLPLSNLTKASHPKISPATTISSQVWKSANKSKILLSKTFNPKLPKLNTCLHQYQPSMQNENKQREYWQSNSMIGNGTPKYLDQYTNAINVILSEQQENTHRSQHLCDCISNLWKSQ